MIIKKKKTHIKLPLLICVKYNILDIIIYNIVIVDRIVIYKPYNYVLRKYI